MLDARQYDATGKVVSVGAAELNVLHAESRRSTESPARLSIFQPCNARLREDFRSCAAATSVQPYKNVRGDESIFIVRGDAQLQLFDDQGAVTHSIAMGDADSNNPYFCRIPPGVFRAFIPRSSEVVIVQAGPVSADPSDITPAVWSRPNMVPAASDGGNALIHMEKISDMVLVATDAVVTLSRRENQFVVDSRREKGVDRCRICVHRTPDDVFHEMLMSFTNATYIRPALHVDKEESLIILAGTGVNVFFDEAGDITSFVRLGPIGSHRPFYCRVPANTYHCLIVESDEILAKETAPGPFRRQDTLFPAWAPDGSDGPAAKIYIDSIRAKLGGLS